MTADSPNLFARALASDYPYRPDISGTRTTHPSMVRSRWLSPLSHDGMGDPDRARHILVHLRAYAAQRTRGLTVRHLEVIMEGNQIGIEYYADRHRPEH